MKHFADLTQNRKIRENLCPAKSYAFKAIGGLGQHFRFISFSHIMCISIDHTYTPLTELKYLNPFLRYTKSLLVQYLQNFGKFRGEVTSTSPLHRS